MNQQSTALPAALMTTKPYRYSTALLPGLILLIDVLAIFATGLGTCLSMVRLNIYTLEYYAFAIVFVTFVGALLFARADLYQINAIMRPVGRSDLVLVGLGTAFLFFLTVAFSLKASEIYSRIWLYTFAAASFFAVVFCRVFAYRVLRRLSRKGVIGRSMVVLGGGEQGRRFVERLDRVQPFFTAFRGVYDHRQLESGKGTEIVGHPVLGGIEDLIAAARAGLIDDIVIALPWNADREVAAAVERLKELPVNVHIASDLVGFQLAFKPAPGHFQQLPMFELVQRPISGWSSVIKAVTDRVLALFILIALSPLLLIVAALIKLDSPGPVFFRQARLGFNNQRFQILKFRSMYHREIPEVRVKQATKGDPRITRIGRFIRRTSIDELPQLLNVLNGTMSLVGPRPHALTHNEEFSREIRGYFARHKVKPGITGWAQVNGLRGETDTPEKIKARVEHDVYYAENWSFLFDMRILLMTVFVVLFQKTAY